MPLPVTPHFEQRLKDLLALSADVATLAEDIAAVQKPEALSEPAPSQTEKLFDRLEKVARQETLCVMGLAVWLLSLAAFNGLTKAEADVFIARATLLGGPQGVVDREIQ